MPSATQTERQLEQLATFIATLNNEKQSHIGFCGTNAEEIQHTLEEDFLNKNGELSFVTAYNETGDIVAAIGADIDEDQAEVWGPFQTSHGGNIIPELWTKLRHDYPDIRHFYFFINEENTRQSTFVQNIEAEKTGKHSILTLQKKDATPAVRPKSIPYNEKYFAAFRTLHNETFPNTYYDADTIISRLKEGHVLKLLTTEHHQIKGYAYYEIDTFYQEGSIEYIAIHPNFRGEGLGTLLLSETTDAIFASAIISDISLVVSHSDQVARRLYMRAGFKETDILNSYVYTKR